MRMRILFPGSQLLNSQLQYYVRGDESRRAQNVIIEFAISLKTRKRNLLYYAFKCGPTVSHSLCLRTGLPLRLRGGATVDSGGLEDPP